MGMNSGHVTKVLRSVSAFVKSKTMAGERQGQEAQIIAWGLTRWLMAPDRWAMLYLWMIMTTKIWYFLSL